MSRIPVHIVVIAARLVGFVAATPFAPAWQLGADDGDLLPFSAESYGPNNAPARRI